MKLKEFLEAGNCDICPLKREGICSGGWKPGAGGEPVEPPCCSWNYDDDTDMEDIANDYVISQMCYEDYLDRADAKKSRKKEQSQKAVETRKDMRRYCCKEIDAVRALEKQLKVLEARQQTAKCFADAINFANEVFRYEERVRPSPIFAEQLSKLELQLAEAKEQYAVKHKEFYNQRKNQEYCRFKEDEPE